MMRFNAKREKKLKKMSHNNFTNGDQSKRKWKLWVAFHPASSLYKKVGENYTYYNFEPDTERNRDKLIENCFTARIDDIQAAILYDNHTKQEITRLK